MFRSKAGATQTLTVLALRAVLVMLFVGSVFGQTVMVWLLARDLDEADRLLADLRTPIVAITVLGIAMVEVILVCLWRLVTMWRRGTVFSQSAFPFVDVVLGAIVAGAVLLFVLAVLLTPGEDVAPGLILMMGGVVVGILGVALIVLVLRMLLAQAIARDAEATRMQAELDEVI